MKCALALLVLLFALLPRTADAVEYPFGPVHVSSAEAGWGASYAADDIPGTVWSSVTGNASSTQWIAAWWASPGYKATNYITIVPRWSTQQNGTNPHSWHVPEMISIYADKSTAPGVWSLIKTVSVPKDIAPTGYRIYFPKILAGGFNLVSSKLRASLDSPTDYRFQVAELKAGFEERFSAWSLGYAAGRLDGIDLHNTIQFNEPPDCFVLKFPVEYAEASRLSVGVDASVSKHPRNTVFATSSAAGNPATNAIDGSSSSYWSSADYSTPLGRPEFVFWFGPLKETNYIKLVPVFVNPPDPPGTDSSLRNKTPKPTYHVPELIDILYADYSGTPQWKLLVEDYALPLVPPEGLEASNYTGLAERTTLAYEIPLPRHVTTDGFKIVAKTMRGSGPNNAAPYKFQLAEAYGGLVTVFTPCMAKIVLFAQTYPRKLYIYGDEPDMKSYPPEAYALAYKGFVDAIRSVDPKAKFSPAGLAWKTNDGALQAKAAVTYAEPSGHFIDWAQQFVDRYKELQSNISKDKPPVAEWRFNISGGILPQDLVNWKTKMSQADLWARSQGAQWALGSFWLDCKDPNSTPPLLPRPVDVIADQMTKMMKHVKDSRDIVTAAWWMFESSGADEGCSLYNVNPAGISDLGYRFRSQKDLLLTETLETPWPN